MRTAIYSDEVFLRHDTGSHPENAGRLRALTARLAQSAVGRRVESRRAPRAETGAVTLVHGTDYLRAVEEAALSGRRYLHTPDCVLSQGSYDAALCAAGAMVDAVRLVHEGRLDNAFIACRPPGHHAEALHAMGFCFFNNVAIGAEVLVRRFGYERVLIFDFDVHHGNGTQHQFEERRDVLFCSMHQHPATLFPGTGWSEEKGKGDGLGYTMNIPMAPDSADAEYLHAFRTRALPACEEFRPQFILVSAGFDAHAADPLANQSMSRAGFDAMIAEMKTLALKHCQGRLVSTLEGGYDYAALSECAESHLEILQSDPS